jgi:hypothetical protein
MKKLLLTALFLGFGLSLYAQETTSKNWYRMSTSETILSFGSVENNGKDLSNVVRFTPAVNFGVQLHKDFSEKVGFYTGLSLRNIGMINDVNDSVRVKQRVYTLGIPVALKFGDMNGNLGAIGFDNEFAINYKQKVFVNDEKSKSNIWFSDRTKIYLPSVFAEFRSKKGNYIRFKYYLTDFLETDNQKLNVAGVSYAPTRSTMFYVSTGLMLRNFDFDKDN